jgi:hypothetical protein
MAGKRMFGAVRRLPCGRWQARYRSPEGRMVSAPETFATKGAAAAWLAAAESDQNRGLWTDSRAATVTLGEYASESLDTRVDLAPRTREIYAAQLRRHILAPIAPGVPALAGRPLATVTPSCCGPGIQRCAKPRARRSPPRPTSGSARSCARPSTTTGSPRTPAGSNGAVPSTIRSNASRPWRSCTVWPMPSRTATGRWCSSPVSAGLRRAELFALRRGDVDLAAGVVAVRRKRLRLASGEVIEGAPKSRAGRRLVALPSPVTAELAHHLRRFTEAGEDAYVFTSAAGMPIEASNFRDRAWLRSTRRAGLTGLRFHDLHHAAGTLAAQTGATTKELMARLGHASPQAAMVYRHASLARDVVIAERLAQRAERAGLFPAADAWAQTDADRHGQ